LAKDEAFEEWLRNAKTQVSNLEAKHKLAELESILQESIKDPPRDKQQGEAVRKIDERTKQQPEN
jgi:hypothetical protein